ncbi:MAG: CDC48 family AAA ATPase [Candidatus Woesearchaeota archaeon]
MSNEINLKVSEALQEDVNKGIVKIDSSYLEKIGVRPGDIVEIEGERKTLAIVDRAYPGDIGLNIVRMDGITRRNAKATIGNFVKVRKAKVTEAKKVVLGPTRDDIVVRMSPEVFKRGLLGRAMRKGDLVTLGGARRRRSAMINSDFFEGLSPLEDSILFGFAELKFIITKTNPNENVIITQNTEVVYDPKAEVEEERQLGVTYEDVGGLKNQIHLIREMIELPLKHPEVFERLGVEPPKGILLHGPPGSGKTLLAKAVANETNANFILINGPEIMSKYYGQSEANLRKKFEDAEKDAPSIIFIDEIDAIATKRDESRGEVEKRVVAQLLSLMDGLKTRGKVVVIAATNLPNVIDDALRRPGRFDREIEIAVPDKSDREDILKIHTRNMPIEGEIKNRLLLSELKNKLDKEIKRSSKKIDQLNSRVSKIESDDDSNQMVSQLKNKIQSLNRKLNSLSQLKKRFNERSNSKLISKIKNIAEDSEIFESDSSENKLTEKYGNSFDEETFNLIKSLINFEVIDKNLLNNVKKEGVSHLLKNVSELTHGFVGADLAALAKEAAMVRLRQVVPDIENIEENQLPKEVLEKLKIEKSDFLEALKFVNPSAMREFFVEVPNISWEDVGGLEELKGQLKEVVELPLKEPDTFEEMGIKPPKGVLLYGPPGTGKTLIAKAVANESEANFILVNGPEILNKWVGESEKAVRKVFEKARQASPCIIFFDEIDSLASRRSASSDSKATERLVNQLLTEMDGLRELHNVFVVAATNRPDIVDPAILRPGRFDRVLLVSAPDKDARKRIFEIHTKRMPLKEVDLEKLANKTDGYVGADIESLCREAALNSIRRKGSYVTEKDFDEAFEKVGPSVTENILESYKEFKNKFRSLKGKEVEESPTYYG